MQLVRNITEGSRLLLAPTSLLGVVAVVLGVAFWGMRMQDSSLDRALHDIVGKTNSVANIQGGATTAHAKTYRILTHIETQYPKQNIAEEILDVQKGMKETRQSLVDMSKLSNLSVEERKLIRANLDLAAEYEVLMKDTLEISLIEIVQGVVFMMQADKKFIELTRNLDLLQQAQDRSMEQAYTAIKRTTQKILGGLLIIGVGTLILFFSRVVGRSYIISEKKREALEAFSHQLETRVEERTKQLAAQVVKVSALNESMAVESAERMKAEEKYRAIFENATEGIFQMSPAGRFISSNLAMARILGYDTPEELLEEVTDIAAEIYVNPAQWRQSLALMKQEGSISQFELSALRKDKVVIWVSVNARLVRDLEGNVLFYEGTMHDVTRRKATEAALQKAQSELVATARQAGMAEIATNVLHNVGNVLNSVNVSAALITSSVRASKVQGLTRAIQLMNEHADDLGEFLASDAKGKMLPGYLGQLAQVLVKEQQGIVEKLMDLTKSVDHIKEIIATQQDHVGASRLIESLQIRDLVDDALRINAGALTRHRVTVDKAYARVPELPLEKGRILQILVNLIGNAKQALEAVTDREPRISVRVDLVQGQTLRIGIADNGVGIAPENLTRVFAHGFTTKKDGHGFGLHSAVNAAREMGGTLTAHSDGPGTGATFTLELPVETTEEVL